jgi:phage terminase small subunit
LLTDKQKAFAHEYMVDKNATKAAIRAGYSKKTASSQGERLLRNAEVRAAVDAGLQRLAEETETEAQWVRRRLREEATDFTEFASHSARIRALELLGKINGIFEIDNAQQAAKVVTKIELVGVRPKQKKEGGDRG